MFGKRKKSLAEDDSFLLEDEEPVQKKKKSIVVPPIPKEDKIESKTIIPTDCISNSLTPFNDNMTTEELLSHIFWIAMSRGVSDVQIRAKKPLYIEIGKKTVPVTRLGNLSPINTLKILKGLLDNQMIEENIFGDEEEGDSIDTIGAGIQYLKKNKVLDFATNGISYGVENKESGRLRVQAFTSSNGLGITCRILNDTIPDLGKLGIDDATLKTIREGIKQRAGLILVTGPTGSGKSTTLAAILDYIRKQDGKHIVTLEDPIEYAYPDTMEDVNGNLIPSPSVVTQQEVGKDVYTYKQGLKDVLRKAPHIILLGEIRDEETMEICIEAAQTGHLVVSTLHTTGAIKTMGRVTEMYPKERHAAVLKQLAELVVFIHSQGLIPTNDGKKVLNYEFLHNNSTTSKSAIQSYEKGEAALKDAIKQTGNVQWDKKLEEHFLNKKISVEAYLNAKLEKDGDDEV